MADRPPLPYDVLPPVPSFTLTSDDLAHEATLPEAHRHSVMGVGGDNVSPHLAWSGFPAETQSFAVTCYDPDAPTGSGFWHWLVVDIPASVTSLPRGAGSAGGGNLPAGARQLRNDFGTFDYGGAAPPPGHGPHRYAFVVHALDVEKLEVPDDASAAFAGFNITAHTLARAILVPVFGR